MRNYLIIIILILSYSCKEKKNVEKEKKVNKVAKDKKIDKERGVQLIGNLYQPEKMVVKENRIGTNAKKEDYQITLTNSDLLDTDLQNVEEHAQKIAIYYTDYLAKNVKPFNFNKIIVKIEHRNKKIDKFEYTLENIVKLLTLK